MNAAQLVPTARTIVDRLMGVKSGEQVCIVTDFERPAAVTEALLAAVAYVGAEATVITMTPRDMGGVEPPASVAAALKQCDAALMQLSFATVHTRAVREALAAGTRVGELWGITEDMMVRGALTEDPDWVEQVTARLGSLFENGHEALLQAPGGTELRVNIAGRRPLTLSSGAREAGQLCSLPLGEAAVAPLEGTAQGVLAGPHLVEHRTIGRPKEPLRLTIKDGLVTGVEGGAEAATFRALLEEAGDTARNIAEFAVGTNRRSRLDMGLREAKKAWGTAHVAVGDNRSLGGEVESPLHIDFIFRQPTVYVDGQLIVQEGRLLVE